MKEVRFSHLSDLSSVVSALRQIETASLADALTIADEYSVANYTPTRTLDVATATLSTLLNFVATFIDDLKSRGPNVVE